MKYRVLFLTLCMSAALILPAAAVTLTIDQVNNAAPIAENLTLTTYKDVAVHGQFAAVDPEGDLITFQLVDTPARGQVTIHEDGSGAFCYTPYEGKKGKDSFSYVAIDSNGNRSQQATVKVTIQKQATAVRYADMEGHEAHYSALRLAEAGVFVGSRTGDIHCFEPDRSVSREEFLAMAMAAAGEEALGGVTMTGFYDDSSISVWAKGYVSAALVSGTVQGSADSEGRMVFHPAAPVTAAEAAVIIDRLLASGDVATESAMADQSVPAWAYQSVVNMRAVDVVPASLSLSDFLTRAQAARMLSAMLDVLESRETGGWFQ